jgi:hypothetical protein
MIHLRGIDDVYKFKKFVVPIYKCGAVHCALTIVTGKEILAIGKVDLFTPT